MLFGSKTLDGGADTAQSCLAKVLELSEGSAVGSQQPCLVTVFTERHSNCFSSFCSDTFPLFPHGSGNRTRFYF